MSAIAVETERRPTFFDQFRIFRRNPDFSLLWSGQVISHLGDAFNAIALVWLVQELTGSRTMMGAVSAAVSATALFGLAAGALVDRWDRRRTMLFSDILRGLVVLILPAMLFADRLQIWHIFFVAVTMGLLAQIFYPAKQSFLPHLVSRDDLAGANALSHMAFTLFMAAGYALGGVMLGLLSPAQLFVFDALTFGVSALTIWLIRKPAISVAPERESGAAAQAAAKGEQASFRQMSAALMHDIGDGLRYMRSDALIATTIPIAILANFIFAPLSVFLAAWSKDVIQAGAQGYGLLEGGFLVGNLLGTLSAASLGNHFRRGPLLIWCTTLMGLPLVLFALVPNLYLNAGVLAFMGFTNGVVNITLITTFQQRTPDHMMGRLFGALTGLAMLAAPLGLALGGALADVIPLQFLLMAIGLLMTLVGLSLFRRQAVTDLL